MKTLELKIHPPIVFLCSVGLAYICSQFLPVVTLPPAFKEFYWCLAGIGVFIPLAGIWQFRQANTTIDPQSPHKTKHLVSGGVYRITRNPMYLGMVLILTAVIFKLGNAYGLIAIPCFTFYISYFQIKPEERILEGIFAEQYVQYKNKVRRWI